MSSKTILRGVLVIGLGVASFLWWRSESTATLERDLSRAIANADWTAAETAADGILKREPTNSAALMAKGRGSHARGEFAEAVAWWDRIDTTRPEAREAHVAAAETAFVSLKRLSEAERRFRAALELDPGSLPMLGQLATLLAITGRPVEANELRLKLLQRSAIESLDLMVMGLLGTDVPENVVVDDFARQAPDDPLVAIARASIALRRFQTSEAEDLLAPLRSAPDRHWLVDALWGELLWQAERSGDIPEWFRELSPATLESASVWRLRGEAARQAGEKEVAARCYWEALQRNPVDQPACYQLGLVLKQLGADEADPFLERATTLQEYLLAVKGLSNTGDFSRAERIGELATAARLDWDAWGWLRLAARVPGASRPADVSPNVRPNSISRVAPEENLAERFDLSKFPLPEGADLSQSPKPATTPDTAAVIRFRDDTDRVGLRMTYENGHDPAFGGADARRAFEFSGGGVAVLDYDRDGWPDLHFPQGTRWPVAAGQREFLDHLYRNRGDGRFVEVASTAELNEDRYSQGPAVGDINNDGFPDLFVANVGRNRLFLNLGDGTFEDVTETAGLKESAWSTSAAIADLDGDGLPDLYVVNYLGGADVTERLCRGPDGRPRECDPHDFPAAPDEVYRNLGDGRFEPVTQEWGFASDVGKGLGIVVGRLNPSDACSVFVANDTDGNLYFRRGAGETRFTEDALLSGVKFDAEGRSLACMGIAAGDATGDGLPDLMITNYYDESNMLFVQQSGGGGLFDDAAAQAGLRIPSLKVLGFGTQFVDADLDGRLDLVVVNGHVARQRRPDVPYEMAPQVFRNRNGAVFDEVSATAGTWFQQKALGRGLARLDWNRDGLDDFAVGHQESPSRLLTNETTAGADSLSVTLSARGGSREAVGAILRLRTGQGEQVQTVTAGDGYMASNERKWIFSRTHMPPDGDMTLQIEWPSGVTENYAVPADLHACAAVEGTGRLWTLDGNRGNY